jgi:hypothetical protein
MALTEVAIYIALIAFLVARRIRGEEVSAPKRLFLLPIIVGAISLQGLTHAKPNAVAIGVIAVGCALSLVFGLWRGRLDKVSLVDGAPYMTWSAGSVALFAVGVLTKLALNAGGVAAGGTSSALSSSILLSLGLTLLAEAVVVWRRTQSLPAEQAAGGQYRGAVQQHGRPTVWPPVR